MPAESSTAQPKLRTGSCLCGAVRYEVLGEPFTMRVCHCVNCKKATGAAFMTNGFFKQNQIRVVKGEEKLKSFADHNTESGVPLNRSFCTECGSNMFLRSDPAGTRYDDVGIIALGTLDDEVDWSESFAACFDYVTDGRIHGSTEEGDVPHPKETFCERGGAEEGRKATNFPGRVTCDTGISSRRRWLRRLPNILLPKMLHPLTRQALRLRLPPHNATKRLASSTSESTQKKAADALATAQATGLRFLQAAQKALGPIGDKAGNLLGSYKQPLLYNLAVGRELVKQIYVKEGLQPPSIATVRHVYSNLAQQIRSPGYISGLLKGGDLGRIGVYGLQAYGIFKIGEIVGRRSAIGYKLD